jgi:hypothetical protein
MDQSPLNINDGRRMDVIPARRFECGFKSQLGLAMLQNWLAKPAPAPPPTKPTPAGPSPQFQLVCDAPPLVIPVSKNGETVVGRKDIKTADPMISRRQIVVTMTQNRSTPGDGLKKSEFALRVEGSNPIRVVRASGSLIQHVTKGEVISLSVHDSVQLDYMRPGMYSFRLIDATGACTRVPVQGSCANKQSLLDDTIVYADTSSSSSDVEILTTPQKQIQGNVEVLSISSDSSAQSNKSSNRNCDDDNSNDRSGGDSGRPAGCTANEDSSKEEKGEQEQEQEQEQDEDPKEGNEEDQDESLSSDQFKVGDLVDVQARTWPGMNKLGGRALVTAVSPPGQLDTLDVKYIVNTGRERGVSVEYVRLGISVPVCMSVGICLFFCVCSR